MSLFVNPPIHSWIVYNSTGKEEMATQVSLLVRVRNRKMAALIVYRTGILDSVLHRKWLGGAGDKIRGCIELDFVGKHKVDHPKHSGPECNQSFGVV